MYDELIKSLRKTSIDFGESDHVSVMLIEAADAIEELQGKAKVLEKLADHWCNKAPKWTPVTERLPDNDRNVLCDDEGGVTVGYYIDEEVGWHDMHCYKIFPTHWMPLPQPPESEGE